MKPSDVENLMQAPPSWSEMMRLHKASAALTLHGEMTKTTPSQNQVRAVEFWFKPKRSWRLIDGDGVVFLQNRRQKIWHRENGVLQQRTKGFTLALDPGELIEMATYWYCDLDSLAPADVRGVEVVVASRLAWEFHPPGRNIIETAVAFDAETGIAVRRSTKSWTTELVSFSKQESNSATHCSKARNPIRIRPHSLQRSENVNLKQTQQGGAYSNPPRQFRSR
ncbi:hypothetical protein [Rhodococcus globerulus]|uniref:Uncharacterized protein n=1 Tax=Rhodococcus globerulus TaxID=33008 RepID=A0ABU4C2P9_RHOGO|nr:hypothetical protein [Rhodococcus globerulus]MDV6270663.1 hypothetical protein [Rhodococcus globerulus]